MRQWIVVLGLIASGCVRGPQVRASGFVVATTQDVELRTDVDAGRAARIARSLQEIHDTFAEHLFPCARDVVTPPVRVTALSHESDVVALVGHDVGGFYRVSDTSWGESQLVVMVRGDETTTEIFAHELAHRFIAICYPRAPVWMNEGLATAFQTVQPADDERMIVGLAPFAFGDRFDLTSTGFVWVTTVPTPLVPTVAELTAMDPAEFYAHGVRARYADLRRTMHYAAAWALVHMLGLGPDDALRSAFDRWLVRIGTSPDATSPFERELSGVDVQRLFRGYLRAEDGVVRYVPRPPSRADATLREMPDAEANVLWAELWGAHEPAQAREHIRLAAGDPEHAADALLELATLERARGDLAAAVATLTRAKSLAPRHRGVLHAIVALAIHEDHPDLWAVSEAIDAFSAVAASAEDFAVLARAELTRGRPQVAHRLARRACRANPFCWRCQSTRGATSMATGDLEQAVRSLEVALALLPHDGDLREALERRLEEARARVDVAPGTQESLRSFTLPDGRCRCRIDPVSTRVPMRFESAPLRHEGCPSRRGAKYAMRTDVLYDAPSAIEMHLT